MNFTRNADINGTSLQGYIRARYSHVVAAFGEPMPEADGYKVSTEWDICFEDGTVATIYDWKSTNLYDSELPSPEALRLDADSVAGLEWHVGGRDKRAVERVRQALNATPEPGRVKTQSEQLQDIGKAHAGAVLEMVAALECDYHRLEELESIGMNADEEGELVALRKAAGECTSREEAEERIREDALSVQVRSTEWYSYGEVPPAPNEFEILLSTGGPACRLIGELSSAEPCNVKLQVQDWGTPWLDYRATSEEDVAFLAYVSIFYFGES